MYSQRAEEPLHRVAPSNPYIKFRPEEIEQSIAARFEQQARRWPTNIAVKTATHELTYGALNRAANQLAHLLLQERGSGAEPVGLLIEHGAPMVTALLAVLKAGKFYVPLDPTYPRERLAYILDDAQVGIVLASDALIGVASDLAAPNVRILSVDAVASGYSSENPDLPIAPEAFAYLLYTSGSSGQPKGVVENQRNVLHFTMVRTNSAHIAADDRLAMLLSFSFSGSATPLYCALLNGAALHLRYAKDTEPSELARWMVAEQITVCITGAATFRQLVSTLNGSERFPVLRLLRVGGEPVYRRDVELFRKHFSPGCLLLNSIGSSEMKNFAEYFIGPDTVVDDDLVPIGYAVEDTEILLIDDDGRAVGVGEIGEIVVKSRFIAPCYWRRPDLTQATFQHAPGGTDERLYRTGDLGRQRPDGALVHLGRKDFQVKIRGYRIETGEVENALLTLAGVSTAVVVAREDQPGDRRLVAYVALGGGVGPQIGAWRAALAAKLPDYMIPASFVVLKSLPVTSTGKVDRAELPQPDRDRPVLETPYVEPRSQLEKVLATLWAEVLGLDRVGVRDDFFEIGGHSLKATQLMAALSASFGVQVPVRTLFASPTVESLAEWIDAALRAKRSNDHEPHTSSLVAVRPGGSRPPLFLIPGGWGGDNEMIIFACLARYLRVDQPFYCFNAALLQRERVPDVVEMARRYLREVREVNPDGPVLLAGECIAGSIAFEMARLIEAAGGDVHLILLDARCPGEERLREFLQRDICAMPEEIAHYYKILLKHTPGRFNRSVRIIASERSVKKNPSLGWDETLHGKLEITVVPGDHDSYIREHVAQTGKALCDVIDAITRLAFAEHRIFSIGAAEREWR